MKYQQIPKFIVVFLLTVIFASCSPSQDKSPISANTQSRINEENVTNNHEKQEQDVQMISYVDSELGFELQFPLDWDGWYIAERTEHNSILVNFVGKSSAASSTLTGGRLRGLTLFYIINEEKMKKEKDLGVVDILAELGTAKGVKYYAVNGTSSPLGHLYDIVNGNVAIDGAEELALVKTDFDKMQQMTEELISVFESFKEFKTGDGSMS